MVRIQHHDHPPCLFKQRTLDPVGRSIARVARETRAESRQKERRVPHSIVAVRSGRGSARGSRGRRGRGIQSDQGSETAVDRLAAIERRRCAAVEPAAPRRARGTRRAQARAWKTTGIALSSEQAVSILLAAMDKTTWAPGVLIGKTLGHWSSVLRFAGGTRRPATIPAGPRGRPGRKPLLRSLGTNLDRRRSPRRRTPRAGHAPRLPRARHERVRPA